VKRSEVSATARCGTQPQSTFGIGSRARRSIPWPAWRPSKYRGWPRLYPQRASAPVDGALRRVGPL